MWFSLTLFDVRNMFQAGHNNTTSPRLLFVKSNQTKTTLIPALPDQRWGKGGQCWAKLVSFSLAQLVYTKESTCIKITTFEPSVATTSRKRPPIQNTEIFPLNSLKLEPLARKRPFLVSDFEFSISSFASCKRPLKAWFDQSVFGDSTNQYGDKYANALLTTHILT